jgi:hypothetical protein
MTLDTEKIDTETLERLATIIESGIKGINFRIADYALSNFERGLPKDLLNENVREWRYLRSEAEGLGVRLREEIRNRRYFYDDRAPVGER